MNRASLKAFSQAVAQAAMNRRLGLQLEVAVSFAIHLDCNQNKRLTRAMLCEVYAGAGYKCAKPGEMEWRNINRRITAALALFDFIGAEEIIKWTNSKVKMDLVQAIVAKLEPLKLKTTNEILEVCGKMGTRSRGVKVDPPGTHHVDTAHVHVVIPPHATRTELMELALAIMKIAEQAPLNGDGHHDEAEQPAEQPAQETVDA